MRRYARFKRPHGDTAKLLRLVKANTGNQGEWEFDWGQFLLRDLIPDRQDHAKICEKWLSAVSAVVGIKFKPIDFSFVLHYGRGDVPSHSDSMGRTSFLVPLLCAKTLIFEEEFQQTQFMGSKLIRFNDFDRHAVHNPHGSKFVILSISQDYPQR